MHDENETEINKITIHYSGHSLMYCSLENVIQVSLSQHSFSHLPRKPRHQTKFLFPKLRN